MEDDMSKFVTIVVLNDGETFTDVTGCSICIIPLDDYERVIQEGGDAKDFNPVVELSLDSVIIPTEEE